MQKQKQKAKSKKEKGKQKHLRLQQEKYQTTHNQIKKKELEKSADIARNNSQ